jgi:hypothetical protein
MVSDIVKLGDFRIPEMIQLRRQMVEDPTTPYGKLARFDAAAAQIRPLLEQHPDWTWGGAELHLRDNFDRLIAAIARAGERIKKGGTARNKDELAALVGEDPEVRAAGGEAFRANGNMRRLLHDRIKRLV